jgi:Tfp pilus assembly protein PilX
MRTLGNSRENEEGTVLVASLVILAVLTVVGVIASTSTGIELLIAGNDRWHKMTFYAADGGKEAGIELLEQNITERGFSPGTVGTASIGQTHFYTNVESGSTVPTTSNWDAAFSYPGGCSSYITMFGNTGLSTGSALQIASGYEGKGKGLGSGGAFILYSIRSFATGPVESESRVCQQYRHVI